VARLLDGLPDGDRLCHGDCRIHEVVPGGPGLSSWPTGRP
jgi:hypothetical protein